MNDKKLIKVRGARENNLKNVNVDLPKDSLIVFSGLSGSGKTTLAFDTIFAEGQRRYVESLSSYARQFLGNLEKPDVDSIEGLSPAIAIDQKGSSHNPRSTVGTVTEIYDYLRLLYARIGVPYCPIHNEPIISFAPAKMVDIILNYPIGSKIQILSPIVRSEKGTHKDTLKIIKENGFQRLRIDNNFCLITDEIELDKNKKHNIDIVIDRIVIKEDIDLRSRIYDAVELALDYSHGYLTIYNDGKEQLLSQHHTCKYCGFSVPKLEPRLFSFNSPSGCCPDCKGLGIKREADESLLIPHPELTIKEGCIEYFKWTVGTKNLEWQEFELLCKLYNVPLDKPYDEMTKRQKDIILYGSTEPIKYTLKSSSGNTNNRYQYIEGIKNKVERLYNETSSEFMREYYEKFMRDRICTTCHGARLNKEALSVRIDNKNIYDVCLLSIKDLHDWIVSLNDKLEQDKYDEASNIIDLTLKEDKKISRSTKVEFLLTKAYLMFMNEELEEACKFYIDTFDNDMKSKIRSCKDYSEIRVYILYEGLVEKTKSEIDFAIDRKKKLDKKVSDGEAIKEGTLINKALEKVYSVNPELKDGEKKEA